MGMKSKWKPSPGILICAILFGVVILGMSVYAAYPEFQLKSSLKKKDYDKAAGIYNEYFVGESNGSKYDELFLSHIKDTKEAWKNNRINYEEASLLLSEIMLVEQKEIKSEAESLRTFILVEGLAAECFEEAAKCMEEQDYEGVLKAIAKIDESYLEYSKVEMLKEDCVSLILNQTKEINSVADYEKWISKLASYHEIVPEAAFLTRKAQLERDLDIFKDVMDIMKVSAELYESGQYKEAFLLLSEGLSKYPDYEKMKAGYRDYHGKYVAKVTLEVEEACEKEEYSKALELVEDARTVHECEEFSELLEYVKEEKSILYRWKNNIVDFFDRFRK